MLNSNEREMNGNPGRLPFFNHSSIDLLVNSVKYSVFGLLLLGLGLLLPGGCTRESLSLKWSRIETPLEEDLNALAWPSPPELFASGGRGWERGVTFRSENAGLDWELDSITRVEIHGMAFSPNGMGRQVGKSGNYFYRADPSVSWTFIRMNFWDNLFDVAVNEEGLSIAVGGGAWERGVILRISPEHQILQVDTFPNELSTICFLDSATAVAAGYGLVLRSGDAGKSWMPVDIQGDHFRDIHFSDLQTGYLIGASGLVARSSDAGKNWEIIRKSGIQWGNNPSLRAVFFTSPNAGYICGDNGLLWKTTDAGETWMEVGNLPDLDLLDIVVRGPLGVVVGEKGTIIRFETED